MLALFNLFVNHFFKNKNSGLLTAIMGAALSDLDLSVDDSIDKAITLVDSAAPPSGKISKGILFCRTEKISPHTMDSREIPLRILLNMRKAHTK